MDATQCVIKPLMAVGRSNGFLLVVNQTNPQLSLNTWLRRSTLGLDVIILDALSSFVLYSYPNIITAEMKILHADNYLSSILLQHWASISP